MNCVTPTPASTTRRTSSTPRTDASPTSRRRSPTRAARSSTPSDRSRRPRVCRRGRVPRNDAPTPRSASPNAAPRRLTRSVGHLGLVPSAVSGHDRAPPRGGPNGRVRTPLRARRDRRRRPRLRAGRPVGTGAPGVDARAGTARPPLGQGRHAAGAGRGPRRDPHGARRPRQRRHAPEPGLRQRAALPRGPQPGRVGRDGTTRGDGRRGHRHRGALLRPRPVARRVHRRRPRGGVPPGVERVDRGVDRHRSGTTDRHRGDPAPRSAGRGA